MDSIFYPLFIFLNMPNEITTQILEMRENADRIARYFAGYMWYDPEDAWCVWNDTMWTWCLWDDYSYYSIVNIVDYLTKWYSPEIISSHYEYSVNYTGENNEYYINIRYFNSIFLQHTETVEQFAERYHKELDEHRRKIESPEYRRKEAEEMRKIHDEFQEQLDKMYR